MTDLYAVIGNPIGHSRSPMIHAAFAEQTGQDLHYMAIEGTPGAFAVDVDALRARGGRGLNITVPFKMDAFAYATTLQEGARQAGAVNCLAFEGDRATGANFDGIGLTNDIQRNLGIPLGGKRVLLMGAGGSARGALVPFLEQGPAEIVLVNRTLAKANELGEQFARFGRLVTIGYDGLEHDRSGFDVVVNATSASLLGGLPPLPAHVFKPTGLAYDLLYGRGLTPFLRLAKDAGVRHCSDGVGMLVEQAAEAFAWWRGVRPDTGRMIAHMTVPLT